MVVVQKVFKIFCSIGQFMNKEQDLNKTGVVFIASI